MSVPEIYLLQMYSLREAVVLVALHYRAHRIAPYTVAYLFGSKHRTCLSQCIAVAGAYSIGTCMKKFSFTCLAPSTCRSAEVNNGVTTCMPAQHASMPSYKHCTAAVLQSKWRTFHVHVIGSNTLVIKATTIILHADRRYDNVGCAPLPP